MYGDNRWNTTLKTELGLLQAIFDGYRFIGRRLELDGTADLQNVVLKIRGDNHAGPVLGYANSMLRPRAVCILVRAITGRAGRLRQRRKHLGEYTNRLPNQFPLYVEG